ncbi:MAG: hypothetical protein NTX03_12355 [Bacteroidetes bacterium]|nr:hypothetical protein [Bacteroidota bacterium]
MDILHEIIIAMDRKDVKNYKIFAGRAFELANRKDLDLFDMLRRLGRDFDEKAAFEKLYGSLDKNSYYQLKNRLAEDVNLSLFLREYKHNDSIYALYITSLGYHYYNRNNYHLALNYFKKAEKKAKQIENYGLLDIIYSRLIKISQEIFSENPEVYIRKRTDNRALLFKMIELENVLQAIEYKVKITQNLSVTNIEEMLKITMDDYLNDEELKDSPKLQFSIYVMLSRKMLQSNDFAALNDYLLRTYESFDHKKLFNKTTHDYKLEMLAWISNSYFGMRQYQESLKYAELLKNEMERYDKMLQDRYEFFYLNTQVLNFSAINPAKAIDILLDLTSKEKVNRLSIKGLLVFVNLAVLYHNQKDYKNSLKYLTKFYNYDGYKNMDDILKLRINLGELMMRSEQGEKDTVEYRIRQINRDFKEILEGDKITWEKRFLQLLSALSERMGKSTPIKEFANETMKKMENENEDSMIFRFADWVKQKAVNN